MKTEPLCPKCGKPKIKISPDNQQFKDIMKELGIKDLNELSDISKRILNMSKYVFDCACISEPFKIQQSRRKK